MKRPPAKPLTTTGRGAMTAKNPKHDADVILRRLEALFDSEREKLVKDVLWEHYQDSIRQAKQDMVEGRIGFGIYPDFWERRETEAKDAAAKAVQPIQSRLEVSAVLAFTRILGGILNDPLLRQMWIQDNARIVGKKGGRPPGSEAPHIEWLRERLEFNDRADPRPTAKEHFRMLKSHPDVEEKDDLGIRLRLEVLGHYGYVSHPGQEEPEITLNSVSSLLTKIRKSR